MPYFDYNATAPLAASARQAWLDAVDQWPANPSSLHRPGTRASRALDQARQELASALECDPDQLLWTSGATESLNTVLHHVAATASPDAVLWISPVEHPAVLAPARHEMGSRLRFLPVTQEGVVDWDAWLESSAVRGGERPALIALMAANNETGVLQPWAQVRNWASERGIPFLCDAVQWVGRLPLQGLGACDWVAGSAHKWGGPRGVGFLKCPSGTGVTPLVRGGSQEDGRRAGTENVAGAVAAVAALKECLGWIQKGGVAARIEMRERFEANLRQAIPEVRILGQTSPRLWNTVMAQLPGHCRSRWLVKLDKRQCAISTGSACASGRPDPSHVLLAMGYSAAETDHVVRLSSGWATTEADWNELLSHLQAVAAELSQEGVALAASPLLPRGS